MALNLPLDEKLAASINRRRIAEEQRKRRIFDSKIRQIGVDVNALNHQVHDSHLNRSRQEDLKKQFDEHLLRTDKIAVLYEQQQSNELKEINKKIDEFRLSVQKPEYRRDFDLYDPDLKKKERPPRVSDNDPCPISGLQKLEGEDLDLKERTAKQKQQVRDILLQQIQENRLERYRKDKEDYEWEKHLLDQDRNSVLLANREAEHCRKYIENLKKDNKNLALQTIERNLHQKFQDNIEKLKDIEYNFYGPLLSEDPTVAWSNLDPNRVIPDRWKGMSKEQLEMIYQGQLNQISENQRKREQEQHEKSVWDQMIISQAKYGALLDLDDKKQTYNINKNLESLNQKLSQEQRWNNDYMNNVEFRNTVTEDFFLQFNKSSR